MRHPPSILALPLLSLLMLAGCSSEESSAAGAGGLTEGEMQQLERAVERIDARPPSPAQAEAEALEAEVRARLAEERRTLEAQ